MNTEELGPLVRRMRSQDPDRRPSAHEALHDWKAMRRQMHGIKRYWRLRPPSHKEPWLLTIFFEFKATVRPVPLRLIVVSSVLIGFVAFRLSPS